MNEQTADPVLDSGIPEIIFSSTVTLEFTRVHQVPVETVWHAITDSDEISDWMGFPCRFEPRVGGLLTVGYDTEIDHAVVCCIVPSKALVTMFRETLIFQTLEDRGDICIHRLRQIGIVPESATSFACGWHHLLDRLAGHLAGHIPELPFHGIEPHYDEQFRAYALTHGMLRPT